MHYHEYILHMLRKEREMSEEWEFDFSNPPRVPPPGTTQCAHCGELIHQDDVLVKVYHTGTTTEQEYFCGSDCHQSWYINRLNQMGL